MMPTDTGEAARGLDSEVYRRGIREADVRGRRCRAVNASNRLTLELNDYDWDTAALDLLWPDPGHAARQVDVIRRLTEAHRVTRSGLIARQV